MSGISVAALVAGLAFIIRLDSKADTALEKFTAISNDVSALRQDMAKDREVIHEHSAQLREQRVRIQALENKQEKQTGKEW